MKFDYIEVLETSFLNCIDVKLCYVINWYVIADSSFYDPSGSSRVIDDTTNQYIN